MPRFLYQILSDFFKSAALPLVSKKCSRQYKAQKIWKLPADTTSVNCYITNTGTFQEERLDTPLYNREDSIAQGLIVSEIEKLFDNKIEANYQMSPARFHGEMPELLDNLVLIGGSVNNSISQELLSNTVCESLKLSFDTSVENRDLHYVDRDSANQTLRPEQRKNGTFCDYAIILNIKNPWSTSRRLVAIMGCNGLGTYGAAKYIKSGQMYKLNKKEIKNLDEYAIIIQCTGLWTNENLRLNASDIHFKELIPLCTKTQ